MISNLGLGEKVEKRLVDLAQIREGFEGTKKFIKMLEQNEIEPESTRNLRKIMKEIKKNYLELSELLKELWTICIATTSGTGMVDSVFGAIKSTNTEADTLKTWKVVVALQLNNVSTNLRLTQ